MQEAIATLRIMLADGAAADVSVRSIDPPISAFQADVGTLKH
jgi:hypothetical protein